MVDRQAEPAEARAKNPDTVAWLYIPGAEVDDPVMQAEDNGYYLKLDENGDKTVSGGVITGGRSLSITNRFRTNGIEPEDVYLGSRIKIIDFDDFCRRHSLRREEVMYFGDDVPDVEVIRAAGIGVCPSDAAIECKEAADIVSDRPGGKALVRKHIEEVMRLQGTWTFDSHAYAAKYKATKE